MNRRYAIAFVGILAIVGAGGAATVHSGALSDTPGEGQFEEVSNSIGFLHFPLQEPENPPGSGRQGVYVADYDNDHWDDLLIVGGRESPGLYENTGGEFERSGALPDAPIMETQFKGALFFDHDNDGWEDLLLLAPYPDSGVFLENHNGSYRIAQEGFYFEMPNGATTLDYNDDGCLDVFVYQNGDWGSAKPKAYENPTAEVETDNGNPNYLLRGNCSTFETVNRTKAGISGNHWSLAASGVDFNGDGLTDIHVANDFYNDTLYYNNGDGTFDRVALGATTDRNGMSSEVADVNGDGRPDLFVTNIRVPSLEGCLEMDAGTGCSDVGRYIQRYVGDRNQGNNLLINAGNETFVERAEEYGVTLGGWGWAASIHDFDNDRALDLFHTSESLPFNDRDNISRPKYYERVGPESFQRRNASRLGFDVHNGRGVATLDYDRDGDLDLVMAEHPRNTVFDIQFYENHNRENGGGNWLAVEVTNSGDAPVLGARVEMDTGDETVVRRVNPRTDFFSQDSRVVHFGLGDREAVESLRVVRPDGTEKRLSDVAANQKLVISPGNVTRLDGPASDDGGLLPFTLPSPGAVLGRITGGLAAPAGISATVGT